jgi:hypothetical protein
MQTLFTFCAFSYVLIYAFEGVIRYGLYLFGQDNLILLRDVLVTVPLALLFVGQAFRMSLHPAFIVFGAIVLLHGAIATFNLHTTLPAIYGAKLLVNVLFGFIAAGLLVQPSRRMLWLLGIVWLVTVTGVALDKFVYTFPWMGLETHIGGIQVDVSRGWDIDSGFDKRAAGFTRSSISAAMLMPTLAVLIAPRIRNILLRFVVVALTVGAVFFTTQKGSLAAIAIVGALLCLPAGRAWPLLRAACIVGAALDVAVPLLTSGLLVPADGGVFSFASFALRISHTWPEAWDWIRNNEVFPFGVGLGGIGGAQRFFARNFFNPVDNLGVFLYANFGVIGVVYLGWASLAGRGLPARLRAAAAPALALLAFFFIYGVALSMLEDQVAALFMGAAAGALWQQREAVRGGRWSDAFRGWVLRFPLSAPSISLGRRQRHARAQ